MARAKWGEAIAWAQVAARYTGDDCLVWPFTRSRGYGSLGGGGTRNTPVHRYVCELAQGPAPEKHDCAHSCGNRLCCNPRHLRWATRAENEADKRLHGTDNRGERHGLSKLTHGDVGAIRALAGSLTQREIGQRFGVGQDQISRIINGKRWTVGETT